MSGAYGLWQLLPTQIARYQNALKMTGAAAVRAQMAMYRHRLQMARPEIVGRSYAMAEDKYVYRCAVPTANWGVLIPVDASFVAAATEEELEDLVLHIATRCWRDDNPVAQERVARERAMESCETPAQVAAMEDLYELDEQVRLAGRWLAVDVDVDANGDPVFKPEVRRDP